MSNLFARSHARTHKHDSKTAVLIRSAIWRRTWVGYVCVRKRTRELSSFVQQSNHLRYLCFVQCFNLIKREKFSFNHKYFSSFGAQKGEPDKIMDGVTKFKEFVHLHGAQHRGQRRAASTVDHVQIGMHTKGHCLMFYAVGSAGPASEASKASAVVAAMKRRVEWYECCARPPRPGGPLPWPRPSTTGADAGCSGGRTRLFPAAALRLLLVVTCANAL